SKLVSFGTGVTALGDGSIVIAANDLLRFEAQAELSAPQSVTSIGKTQGLDYGELIVGLEDRFGNVWVTDSRRGLWRVALRGSRSFDSGQISSPLIVQALKQLRDGTMLAVGNSLEETREPHRVLHWNGREWLESRYPHPAGQVDTAWGVNQIVIEDANGAAWFAADDGLRGYRAGTRLDQLDAAHSDYFIGPKQNLPADQPMRVWADSHGLWWITYLNHDPYRFDPRTKQSTRLNLDSPPGESDRKRPRAYLEDDRGLVWFAYARGIGRPRADDSWEYVPIPDLAGFGNTEDIAFDSSGALWIATGVGLFHTSDPRAASPSFTRVWPAPGVIPRIVLAIKVSKTGQLYAGSDVGVLVFDITTRMIEQYGAGSGLPGSSVTALELDADGKMWVGTTRGIAILPTLELPPSEVPDPLLVRVTTPLRQLPLMLAGQRLLTGLTLQPDERALDVFVRSIVMQADRRVSYRTRLDGVDRDWSPPSTQRQLRIAGLSTGHYSLRIRAEDQTGRVSNNEARIDFDVRAPFYERPWFAAAILGAIALGALVWQRQQAQRALAIERTRTTIATDLHDEIGAGLSRIAVLSESLARGRRAADRTDRDRSDHDRSEPTRADSSPEVTPNQIAEIARRLVDRMSDLVWAINPERDRAFSLVQRMRRFATPLLRARGIALQLRAIDEEHDRALDGELRRELLLIFQESINNAVKHSECSRVTVDLAFEADRIVLTVADDGRGFVVEGTAEGTGLSSIRKRAARLGGTCDINAVAAEGTRIRVSAPLKRRR
ncbi:MAG: two-component regulator propeller domain-containing protein, partial [Acidobacteriota bacterium]